MPDRLSISNIPLFVGLYIFEVSLLKVMPLCIPKASVFKCQIKEPSDGLTAEIFRKPLMINLSPIKIGVDWMVSPSYFSPVLKENDFVRSLTLLGVIWSSEA